MKNDQKESQLRIVETQEECQALQGQLAIKVKINRYPSGHFIPIAGGVGGTHGSCVRWCPRFLYHIPLLSFYPGW